jgi:hypothetical protein
MCPTANEAFFLLKSQTFRQRVIKLIGLELSLGVRQLQLNGADRVTGDAVWCLAWRRSGADWALVETRVLVSCVVLLFLGVCGVVLFFWVFWKCIFVVLTDNKVY